MTFEVLDPTHEDDLASFRTAPKLATLQGIRLAVISNGKKGTKPFFDALELNLIDDQGVEEVVRLTKDNYSAPVDAGLLADAAQWDALVTGVGD